MQRMNEKKLRNQSHLHLPSNNKIPTNKFTKVAEKPLQTKTTIEKDIKRRTAIPWMGKIRLSKCHSTKSNIQI